MNPSPSTHLRPRPLHGLAALALLALVACSHAPAPRADADEGPRPAQPRDWSPPPGTPEAVEVAEAWIVDGHDDGELDSIATWLSPDGQLQVVVTAKRSHELRVFDGGNGDLLRTVGGRGDGPGRFNRPNGVAIHGDVLFVAERDNHRVQMLSLPDFQPLGEFGADRLEAPYGLWLTETAPGRLMVVVTDSFMRGRNFEIVPPLDTLDRRLHRFLVDLSGDRPRAAHAGSFGETTREGAIRVTESVWGDPFHQRLLVADEHVPTGLRLLVYGLDGGFLGTLGEGLYKGDPEGLALWACADGSGYWISVDQRAEGTVFNLYDRRDLSLVGRFRGRVTADTDGIALFQAGTARFPDGVLYATHEDRAVSAFDWGSIARRLDLPTRCSI